VVVFAIAWLFDSFVDKAEKRQAPTSTLAKLRPERPPAPRLQQSPAFDMRSLRAVQLQRLTTADWIDKQAGVVQMPIERAMELMAKTAQSTKTGSDLPRTEQNGQGLPKWPRFEVEKPRSNGTAAKADRKAGTDRLPTDVVPAASPDPKREEQK